MGKGVFVRLLIPKRDAEGKIRYQAEMHWVRLPIKREDRDAFLQRLASE